MGILQLSDQSAQFEAILFAETLAQYRDILEPGANVVVTVQASLDADEMRVRVQSAQVLDRAMLERHKGVQIKVFEEAALPAIASHLHQGGDIEVSLSMVIDNGAEVELRLPGQYSISPGLLGILKNTPGVADAHLY
jgi:DNA polymerase-3 subunit alpha